VSIYPLGTCRQLRTSRGSRVYSTLLIERQSLIHQTTIQERTGDTLPLEVTAPIVVWVRANSRIPLVGSRNARRRCVRSAARCTDGEKRELMRGRMSRRSHRQTAALRPYGCIGVGGRSPSRGPRSHAGMCLLGPISSLRLLGLIRSLFRAGDFDILPSLGKRPTVRTEERQKLRQGSTSCFSP
jgi:hypothetical protein